MTTGHPGPGGTRLGAPCPRTPEKGHGHTRGHAPGGQERPGQRSPARDSAGIPGAPPLVGKALPGAAEQHLFAPRRWLQKQCTLCTLQGTAWKGEAAEGGWGPPGLRAPDPSPPHTPCVLLFLPASPPGRITQGMLKDPKTSSRRAPHPIVGEGTAL